MSEAFRCVFGPRLFRIYSNGGKQASYMYSVSVMASPIIGYFMIKRGFCSMSGIISLAQFGVSCLIILAGSYCIRGYGRLTNMEYRKFLKVLIEVQKSTPQYDARKQLALYDFQFSSWPVDFHWDESHDRYIVAHWFARPLMYPGSIKLLQNAMGEVLNDGRSGLVAQGGWRAKLRARDGNEIDTMFIDRRTSDHENGQILMIGCEGNAAFYEAGTIHLPLKAGYSVLGWNHPGFGGSSGLPHPDAEKNAVDVVIRYATDRLGFPIENIVILAWSIGGYSASWAAMTYPDIKGLILDATFDTITPLAVERMPRFLANFTEDVINDYFPLFVHEHLSRYFGPVLLYRRTKDEMISVVQGDVRTNRGNYLLVKILTSRYPNLITKSSLESLTTYLAADHNLTKSAITSSLGVDFKECKEWLNDYKENEGSSFPCLIGGNLDDTQKSKLLLYLVSRYLIDVDTTHCTPLPLTIFQIPQPV